MCLSGHTCDVLDSLSHCAARDLAAKVAWPCWVTAGNFCIEEALMLSAACYRYVFVKVESAGSVVWTGVICAQAWEVTAGGKALLLDVEFEWLGALES